MKYWKEKTLMENMSIAAWGENCRYHNRYKDIHELFRGYDLHCLRKKRIGSRDTLYI